MKKTKAKKEELKTPKKATIGAVPIYPLILILLVGILCYSNTLHGPFVFDDAQNIVELEGVHLDSFSASELSKLGQAIVDKGRPVAMFSLALNYYFGGLDTFGYHLVNLCIHLLTAFLVYLFLKLTLGLPGLQERYGKWAWEIALLSGLLFVAHPIQTQAVSYIVQRMASLAALFFLLALYCYAKARLAEGNVRTAYFAGSVVAALLAFGSKENSITLPFFIALYEYYFYQRLELGQAKKRWLYTIIGLLLLAGLLAGIYIKFDLSQLLAGYKTRTFTPGQRMLTQLRVVGFYLSLLILPLPSRLNLDHHFPLSYSLLNPPTTLLCLVFILGLIAGSVYLAKKRPLISFFIIWFWANLVLESSFLPLELVFEHRLYLPSVGFFLLLSILLVKGIEKLKIQAQLKQQVKLGFLLALIIPLSVMTYQRNKVWQDALVLWEDAVGKSPGKARSNYNLGHIYAGRGRLAEAITQYQRTLEIDPAHKDAHNNLANIYIKQGKPEQAIAEHLAEVKHNPDNAKAYHNLGNTYMEQGLKEKAFDAYQKAVQIAPNFSLAYLGLGDYYEEKSDYPQAIGNYQKALELEPNFPEALYSLGQIYEKQQAYPKAIQLYQQAIQLKPGLVEAYLKLGALYLNLKYYQRAQAVYERALQIQPRLAEAHYNLGIVYTFKGVPRLAEQEYLTVLKLKPDHALAHKELGIIYLEAGNPAQAVFHFQKSLVLSPRQLQAAKMRQVIEEQQKQLSP